VLAGGVTVLNHLCGWMNGPLVEIRKACWHDGTYWVEVSVCVCVCVCVLNDLLSLPRLHLFAKNIVL